MPEHEPQKIEFWDYWKNRFLDEGLEEDFVDHSLARYKSYAQDWHKGEAEYKKFLNELFEKILDTRP